MLSEVFGLLSVVYVSLSSKKRVVQYSYSTPPPASTTRLPSCVPSTEA